MEYRYQSVVLFLFYTVIALLLKHDIETQSHDGARTQFGLNFVRTGIKLIRGMGNFTQNYSTTDKKEIMEICLISMRKMAKPLIEETRLFLNEIERLIKAQHQMPN